MFVPVYLFTGPEFGKRNDAVNDIKKSLKKQFGEIEEYSLYASETPVSSVVEILQSESLFVPASCVIYRGVELIKKKEDIERLGTWISSVTPDSKNKNPKCSSVLILISDEFSVDSKLEKLIPKDNKTVFWEMFEDKKIPWIRDFFSKNGFSIQEDACEEILDMVENNTEALRTECSRFFVCFQPGAVITVDDVDAILANNRSESAFTLFDVMADPSGAPGHRLENALSVLQKIRLSKDSSSVMILMGLALCFRNLSVWHKLSSAGTMDDFNLKINGFNTKKKKTQYGNASRVWSSGQTAAILSLISSTDMEIRSGGQGMEDTLLQMMLYEIIIKKGAPVAEWEEGWA